MTFALITLSAFLAVAQTSVLQVDHENNMAWNYHAKIGLPLADEIRKAESSRIVGGSPATANAYPYQAGILAQLGQGQGVCGASLVRNDRLLTAAHCWFDGVNQASLFIVVLGSQTLFSGGTRLQTNEVIMHGGWNPYIAQNDIAVIRLISSVTFSDTIAPIALPSRDQLYEDFLGETATASGYGVTSDAEDISASQFLSHVEMPVITNTDCSAFFPLYITSSKLCTSGANGRSTCRGDSGGPLAVTRDGSPLLIGISAFYSAVGCSVGYPAVFTRVTSFTTFINLNL